MDKKYDIILYGASGFTGQIGVWPYLQYVLEEFMKSEFSEKHTLAIAGRNESKLRKTLKAVSDLLGRDITQTPVFIAATDAPHDLDLMAKQARLIVNVVGPYRLHGEAVVRAAVENGTHHVDISGEPAFLEKMHQKFGEKAKETGAYIVGACGWDSIPCDMGTEFLRKNFDGTLCYEETAVQLRTGDAGYVFNDGTYQTLILALTETANDNLGQLRRAIMPQKLEKPKFRPPRRSTIWYNKTIDAWCLPFMGSDKSVVQRSQYHNATVDSEHPSSIETYFAATSWLWAWLGLIWLVAFSTLVKFEPIRRFCQRYPSIGSVGAFSASGPTREQCQQASFTYWLHGVGWPAKADHAKPPTKEVVVRCGGPDAGYIGTSGCVLSAALTLLEDSSNLPPNGGVYTTSAAFKHTNIFERLHKFGIKFVVDESKTPSRL